MLLYKTIYESAEAEYIIDKSRFIAHASPAVTTEEAKIFIAKIKARYKDATHNVPAFICGEGMEHMWASDDGEPSGTSGMPILKLIEGEGLTNIAVVVTRYFGGIKLGTGGLARAYSHAAGLAIDKAGICEVREGMLFTYNMDYTYLSKLQNLSSDESFQITDTEYGENVKITLSCETEHSGSVKSMMADLTAGRASLLSEEKTLTKKRL